MAVSTKMAVFWVVAPGLPDDGGSKDLWNVGKLLPDYMALQPRRQPSSKKKKKKNLTANVPLYKLGAIHLHKGSS
jgi:hypothetical protein